MIIFVLCVLYVVVGVLLSRYLFFSDSIGFDGWEPDAFMCLCGIFGWPVGLVLLSAKQLVTFALLGLVLTSCALHPPLDELVAEDLRELNQSRRVNGHEPLTMKEFRARYKHCMPSWDSMLSFGPYHSFLYERRPR